jgi:hypothetical protein
LCGWEFVERAFEADEFLVALGECAGSDEREP